jgi:spoIIIJ-associated protein
MKKEITVSAKSVEEAVAKAVAELGAPSADKIEYTVIEEAKKGFLGIGASDAKISATYVLGGEYEALAFVEKLIKDMNINADITMNDGDNGEKIIAINGKEAEEGNAASILIGHHGETLDSLQYLANLAANKKSDENDERNYTRILVDIENYRAKRAETLRALARRMAQRVLKYKRSVTLEPMSAYERRIIHSEIQGIEGVTTYSVGADNNRKVVIQLED